MPLPETPADDALTERTAEDALLASLLPPKGAKASEEDDDDQQDADEDEDSDDTEEDLDDEDDDAEDGDSDDEDEDDEDEVTPPAKEVEKAPAVSDDTVLKLTIDGVETDVTVGSLKELAGKQDVLAKKTTEVDLVGGRAALMIQNAIETIAGDLKDYEGVDWLSLQTKMEPEEFQWHRAEFVRLSTRLDKMVGEANALEATTTKRREDARQEQAAVAVVELTRDIPEWGDKLYGEIVAYAVKEGLPKEDVSQIANAKIIKLLNKARLYDLGAAVVAEKVKMAPNRVKRAAAGDRIAEGTSASQRKLEKMVSSGRGSEQDMVKLLAGRLTER